MFDLSISVDDKNWLASAYPKLKIYQNKGITEIAGPLSFSMSFLEEGKYVINPKPDYEEGLKIEDEYQIRIELRGSDVSNLPQVYETGSRINNLVERNKKKLEDLHVNLNGAACLCIKPEEIENLPNGFNLKDFFNNSVIPFFYAQSYFEKNGTWPWGEYGHGITGLIEWYRDQRHFIGTDANIFLSDMKKCKEWPLYEEKLRLKRGLKGHHECYCGSKKKFRDCHKKVLEGLWKLRNDLKN